MTTCAQAIKTWVSNQKFYLFAIYCDLSNQMNFRKRQIQQLQQRLIMLNYTVKYLQSSS